MSSTLVLNFHPAPVRSRVNAALAAAIAGLPEVELVEMAGQIGADGQFDLSRETARLLDARAIVLQFPIHWYTPPALLAQWQAQLMTQLFYIDYPTGAKLKGKPLMVAASAGGNAEAYSRDGQNGFALPELLYPLQATANNTGLVWLEPHLTINANAISEEDLATSAAVFAGRVAALAEASALVSA